MSGGEILVNQLFAGQYLSEGSNIGHEIINLFEDDGGTRFLYITPSGIVRGHNVEQVIFVRNTQARKTVEIIAIATGLNPVSDDEVESIRYGGAELSHIFRSNTYHGGEDVFSGIVTYRADEVRVPSDGARIFLTIEDDFDLSAWPGSIRLDSQRKVIIPQGMRMYYSASNDPAAYAQLVRLIADDTLWQPAAAMGRLVADGAAAAEAPSFLEVIGKEDDELAFSNLLAYYFDYSHDAFREFAADERLLDIPDMDAAFDIVRESNFNIDLWIESDRHLVIIENKIKSGINGIGSADGSQLGKYLSKARAYADEHGKQAHFYVLTPDYNNLDLTEYDPAGAYKVVLYSAVFDFFVRKAPAYITDRYFPEFLRGLERHTMTASELNFKTMRARFMRKISQAQ